MPREQTTIRLPAELMEQLRREADRRGYSIRDLVVFILRAHVSQAIAPE